MARHPLLLLHDPSFGGMGRAATFLSDACRDAGIATQVLTLTTPGRSNVQQGRLTSNSATHALHLAFELVRTLTQRRATLVYLPIAQWGLPLARDSVFIAIARAFRIPTVIHLHGSALAQRLAHPANRRDRVVRRIVGKARWVVLSEALREVLVSSGVATDVRVLRNPAEAPPEPRANCPGRPLGIGFLGNCSRVKGLDLVATGVARCREILGEPIELVVAGPEGDVELPQEPWVSYCGTLSGDQLESFWSHVDVLMLPARRVEGLPFVILEALQRRKLVVASGSLGLDELISEHAITVIEPEESRCIDAIVRTARHFQDDLAKQQEAWARIRERFTPEVLRQEWLEGIGLRS